MKNGRSVRLALVKETPQTATLEATLPVLGSELRYRARSEAVVRIDGVVRGTFDRKHDRIALPPRPGDDRPGPHQLELEVERTVPPPPEPWLPGGTWWRGLRSVTPSRELVVEAESRTARRLAATRDGRRGTLELIAHAHLDVAWLWTYARTMRKAVRTFATACRQLELDPDFIFTQSQPQLYAFVEQAEPPLFAEVQALARGGRFDASVAAMWVEPDCNLPCGESLLRQVLYADRYVRERLGTVPTVAWLPDTFGFANTLPMLLQHAGIAAFATTKLTWNDTTRFPHAQFVWRAPDGSSVDAALLLSYQGPLWRNRVAAARRRGEPLVVGHGDGGGGVTDRQLERARAKGHWSSLAQWFAGLAARRASLPVYEGELYLEYHRGTYTSHRDVKAGNARLERSLAQAEEVAAWCVSVRSPRSVVQPLLTDLRTAWTIALRNQFHDVLAGTSIGEVYADVREEYAKADRIVQRVIDGAASVLPRASFGAGPAALRAPRQDGREYVFDNGLVAARVRPDGTVVELTAAGGRSVVSGANVLRAYRDRPKRWDAWNIDAGYVKHPRRVRAQGAEVVDDALEARFSIGASGIRMRVSLREGEPFLRVALAIAWRERHVLLRVEHRLGLDSDEVRYGTPHGTIVRSARAQTKQEQAAFEVPGQRFAAVADKAGSGFAQFALDTYGWSARTLRRGGLHLGHSLLRGPVWPDPQADLGEQQVEYALVPLHGATAGALENAWLDYAQPRIAPALFTCDDPGIVVAAVKPAEDGAGVILRVRECDGLAREVAVTSAGRAGKVEPVDGCERPVPGEVRVDHETLRFAIGSYALRSFRIRP